METDYFLKDLERLAYSPLCQQLFHFSPSGLFTKSGPSKSETFCIHTDVTDLIFCLESSFPADCYKSKLFTFLLMLTNLVRMLLLRGCST